MTNLLEMKDLSIALYRGKKIPPIWSSVMLTAAIIFRVKRLMLVFFTIDRPPE